MNVPHNIYDFFTIDIQNIFKYLPLFIKSELNEFGSPINRFHLELMEMEMDMFDKVEIILHPNNEKTITFIGFPGYLSEAAYNFINFCVKEFGKDLSGEGFITKDDMQRIFLGQYFSRMWKKVDISNLNQGQLSITLFDVPYSEDAIIPQFQVPNNLK
ncbi:hypothetical protein [Barnesiella intestinihominis]|uniref:hypothetical protein n=1 Tax=Barnesiella intestinihominis TaxID=487174 RepID=UPI003AEF6F38